MLSFIAAIFGAVWIQQHWQELLIGLGALIFLIAVLRARRKRQREAYLAMPVLFIGNKSTRVFHTCGCPKISNLSLENTVAFRTTNEVQRSGYKACGHCCQRL